MPRIKPKAKKHEAALGKIVGRESLRRAIDDVLVETLLNGPIPVAEIKFSADAIDAVRGGVENMFNELMEMATAAAVHRGSSTLTVEDVRLARNCIATVSRARGFTSDLDYE